MDYMFSMILLFAGMAFAFFAQASVKSTFGTYDKVRNHRGITGEEAARAVLDSNGLTEVEIRRTGGVLSDNYDPRGRVLNLSEAVYDGVSISAVSVACHEVGHAIQHDRGYLPLKFRNAIVPLVNFASGMVWPMVFIGFILMSTNSWYLGNTLFNLGILAMVAVVLFHLVTLPVELDASNRAIKQMRNSNLVEPEEVAGAKRVLRAAAMTYIAALAVSMANLIRLLVLRRND